jgi:hypothetical protein
MDTNRRSFLSGAVSMGTVASIAGLSGILMSGSSALADHERERERGRDEPRYPRISSALAALREARTELASAPNDFNGRKESALHAVDDAIHQLEVLVDDVNRHR